jgi:hypothetical protein
VIRSPRIESNCSGLAGHCEDRKQQERIHSLKKKQVVYMALILILADCMSHSISMMHAYIVQIDLVLS